MRLLTCLFAGPLLLCASTTAFAQSNQPGPQAPPSACASFSPFLKKNITVTLKDKHKLKGKLIAVQADQLELADGNKNQTIACAEVASVGLRRGIGHHLRATAVAPIMIAGFIIALPGLIVAKTGAQDAGLIIAVPGLLLFTAGCELGGGSECFPLLLP